MEILESYTITISGEQVPIIRNMAVNCLLLSKDVDLIDEELIDDSSGQEGLVLSVNASDRFCPNSPLWIPVTEEDIPYLHDYVVTNNKWGALQWVILKFKDLPHPIIEESMRKDNSWLVEFEYMKTK